MHTPAPSTLFVVGICIFLALAASALGRRLRVPALLFYLLIGGGLQWVDAEWVELGSANESALEFLAEFGLALLLFRVGLESDVKTLRGELGRASAVWFGNVLLSAGLGYVVARYWLAQSLTSSLFVAVALSATSVALSVSVWDQVGRLATATGQRLLDVAQLDDISAVIFLSVILAVAPALQTAAGPEFAWTSLVAPISELAISLVLFIAAAVLFVAFIEHRLTDWLFATERTRDAMLSVAAVGMSTAAWADALGLSVAVGALTAGLMFSGDHRAREFADQFAALVHVFSPFFFIGIGLAIPATALFEGAGMGLALLAAAVVGKVVGGGGVALFQGSRHDAWLLGISLVPRAEIAMVVAHKGHKVVPEAMSDELFAAIAFVCVTTCVVVPLALRVLMGPPKADVEA